MVRKVQIRRLKAAFCEKINRFRKLKSKSSSLPNYRFENKSVDLNTKYEIQ